MGATEHFLCARPYPAVTGQETPLASHFTDEETEARWGRWCARVNRELMEGLTHPLPP